MVTSNRKKNLVANQETSAGQSKQPKHPELPEQPEQTKPKKGRKKQSAPESSPRAMSPVAEPGGGVVSEQVRNNSINADISNLTNPATSSSIGVSFSTNFATLALLTRAVGDDMKHFSSVDCNYHRVSEDSLKSSKVGWTLPEIMATHPTNLTGVYEQVVSNVIVVLFRMFEGSPVPIITHGVTDDATAGPEPLLDVQNEVINVYDRKPVSGVHGKLVYPDTFAEKLLGERVKDIASLQSFCATAGMSELISRGVGLQTLASKAAIVSHNYSRYPGALYVGVVEGMHRVAAARKVFFSQQCSSDDTLFQPINVTVVSGEYCDCDKLRALSQSIALTKESSTSLTTGNQLEYVYEKVGRQLLAKNHIRSFKALFTSSSHYASKIKVALEDYSALLKLITEIVKFFCKNMIHRLGGYVSKTIEKEWHSNLSVSQRNKPGEELAPIVLDNFILSFESRRKLGFFPVSSSDLTLKRVTDEILGVVHFMLLHLVSEANFSDFVAEMREILTPMKICVDVKALSDSIMVRKDGNRNDSVDCFGNEVFVFGEILQGCDYLKNKGVVESVVIQNLGRYRNYFQKTYPKQFVSRADFRKEFDFKKYVDEGCPDPVVASSDDVVFSVGSIVLRADKDHTFVKAEADQSASNKKLVASLLKRLTELNDNDQILNGDLDQAIDLVRVDMNWAGKQSRKRKNGGAA